MKTEAMRSFGQVVGEVQEVPDLLNPEITTAELAQRLPAWECIRCGEPMRGYRPSTDLCEGCGEKADQERRRTVSREDVFKPTRTPLKHRAPPPWEIDNWPRDPRKGAASICPALDWPELVAGLVADPAAIGPRSAVLTGANDVGKSHRAADLLFRLHRAAIFGATWVHESELVAELDFAGWQTRPMEHAAREAPVLVLDDIFSHRGGPVSVEEAAGLMLKIVEARWANPYKVTIYTTHRYLSGRAAAASTDNPHEAPGLRAASVEALAPAVLGRWRDGLVLDLGRDEGHRGEWAK